MPYSGRCVNLKGKNNFGGLGVSGGTAMKYILKKNM
jgi:hypothetical protein